MKVYVQIMNTPYLLIRWTYKTLFKINYLLLKSNDISSCLGDIISFSEWYPLESFDLILLISSDISWFLDIPKIDC